MDTIKIITLRREDLNHFKKSLPIEDVALFTSFNNFRQVTSKKIAQADFIIFIDDANTYNILKKIGKVKAFLPNLFQFTGELLA